MRRFWFRRWSMLALLAAVLTLAFWPVVVAAQQATASPVNGVLDAMDDIDLSSTGGVLIVTAFVVQFIKTKVTSGFASTVPIWAYTVIVSGFLTWFAHDELLTLHGDLPHLMMQSLLGAMAASGGYEWLRAGLGKPMAAALNK